ncbi:MAG TPA: iron-sulfur cluster assembly protein [Candidatus Binataceae bacterium]|nr:iron-sulfur cluster assembly protein [Candidatus Binataceae bacterium]
MDESIIAAGPDAQRDARLAALRAQLAAVLDPELDEPITELGFVEAVEAGTDGRVRVRLRLPTYWCAANFAFMIAADVRQRLAELPWVRAIAVELADHYCGGEIGRAVSQGHSFAAAFADQPGGDLDELRAIFRAKAFMRRQERLGRYLLARGCVPAELAAMSIGELAALPLTDADGARLRELYLEARRARRDGRTEAAPALVRSDGRALCSEELAGYLAGLRRVTLNIEFNAELCRGLLRARTERTVSR